MRQLDYKPKSEAATCGSDGNVQQNCTAETNVVAYSSSDSVNNKLVKADMEVIAPTTTAPRVEQARVAAKRGKLACRTLSSSNASSHISQNSSADLYQVGEDTNQNSKTSCHATCSSEKYKLAVSQGDKLHAAGQRYRLQHDNSANADFVLSASNVSIGTAVKNNIQYVMGQIPRICQKSQLLSSRPQMKSSSYENCKIYCDRHREKMLTSKSFRTNTRETKQTKNLIKKPDSILSQSLRSKYSKTSETSLKSAIHSPKLDRLSTIDCYTNCIVFNENREPYNTSKHYMESNLSPPPLSTLQIFAISTKPLDIQVAPVDSIPNDIDELPSLPIINVENKLKERKLSILEPPPPNLVSRQESNDNWNRFLIQLNSILESRVGEFV
jgi:hypothetical protein